MTFLDRIAADRERRVEEAKGRIPEAELRRRAEQRSTRVDLSARLDGWSAGRRAVIAEIKRRSPSKGDLRPELAPVSLARGYEAAGAFAISVLTEPAHFGGSVADLAAIRAAVQLPLLYKDFVLDPYQLWEARAHGADLVLLIAALLGDRTRAFVGMAREVGLEPLVEVHDAPELAIATASGARFIGVNNRNLKTFEVSLDVSRELIPTLPAGSVAVAESGLRQACDLDDLGAVGARLFLIGEALVTKPDPAAALREFVERCAGTVAGPTARQ